MNLLLVGGGPGGREPDPARVSERSRALVNLDDLGLKQLMEYSTLIHSSLVRPDWFGNPSIWRGHVPFAIWLVQSLKPKIIVDLGIHRCGSYFNFCRAVRTAGLRTTCYGVDAWKRDEQAEPLDHDGFADAYRYNDCMYADISRLLRMRPDEAAGYFTDGSIDLLHINGVFNYETTKRAFDAWLPKLAYSAVVLFHHTNVKEGDFGVRHFWEELTRRYPLNIEFLHSQGLGVLQLLPGEGSLLLDWLLPDSAEVRVIREYFGMRGVELEQQFDSRCILDSGPHYSATGEPGKEIAEIATLRHALAKRDRAIAEIANFHRQLAERDGIISELRIAAAERDAMANSISWRMTKPFRLAVGVLSGEPAYLTRLNELVGRLHVENRKISGSSQPSHDARDDTLPDVSVRGLVEAALPELMPFATYPDLSPSSGQRLTVVSDSLGAEAAFGSMDFRILLAVALARHRGLRLRFVTRDSPPEPAYVGAVLAAHNFSYSENIEFEYAPARADARALADTGSELVLTTSWSTTWAARKSFDPSRIIYLVQDDESLFYPAGDQQLRCREILCDPRLRFVVTSSELLDYLVAKELTGIAASGIAIGPAFPGALYYRVARASGAKRRFLFDARPNTPRNSFLRGLEAVGDAIENGSLPASDWDFLFVGKQIPPVELPRGVKPTVAENLSRQDFDEMIRHVDVGLSLMCTPQLGYPALMLAASGAVVVTNRVGSSSSSEACCANILRVDPSLGDLVSALARAAELAGNEPLRQANYESARIARDWDAVFAPAFAALPR